MERGNCGLTTISTFDIDWLSGDGIDWSSGDVLVSQLFGNRVFTTPPLLVHWFLKTRSSFYGILFQFLEKNLITHFEKNFTRHIFISATILLFT